jgi:hypothetical protein
MNRMVISVKKLDKYFSFFLIGLVLVGIGAYLGREKIHDLLLPEGAKTYTSEAGKYSLTTLRGWSFDASRVRYPVDTVLHDSQNALIFIDVYDDPALMSDDGRFFLKQQIEKNFRENPKYSLESIDDEKWKGRQALVIRGTRKDGQTTWNFFQYVVFSNDTPRTYNITASVKSDAPEELKDNALDMIDSFRFK